MRLRYLHISDLHLTGRPEAGEGWAVRQFNQDLVTRSMLEAIEDLVRREGRAPHLVFLTGDLAQRGVAADYRVAEAFCQRLLEVTNLPPERLYLVPGNHDVDRCQVEERHIRWWYNFENEDQVTEVLVSRDSFPVFMRKFGAFNDFAGRAMGCPLFSETKYYYTETAAIPLEGGTVSVNVVGLNSALFSGYDGDDRGKLAFGLPQVDGALGALDDEAWFTVALFHHPWNCFHPADRVCRNLLTQRADLVLTGHHHRPDNAFTRGAAGEAIWVGAGASFETRQSENSFNVVESDLRTGEGEVQFWKYLPGFHRWKENTDANPDHERGIFAFTIDRLAQRAVEQDVEPTVESATPSAPDATMDLQELRRRLIDGCSVDDLKDLCFFLGIDDDNYPDAKNSFVRELLRDLRRQRCVDEFVAVVRREKGWVLE